MSARLLRAARAAIALALLLAPRVASACSVCGAGANDGSQTGFLLGTLLLSTLPLVLIGGAVWFLVRRARKIAAEEAAGVIRLAEPPAAPRTRPTPPPQPNAARVPRPVRG